MAPTPVLLPEKSHGRGSLVGYSPWGCKQSDVTEQFHFHKIGNFHQIMSKFSSAVELFDSPIRPITCANHQDEVHNLASLQPMHSVPMEKVKRLYLSVRFSSVTQSCPTVHPMNCSTLGLPVHHRLPEFTQTHIHRVSDDIQPSHPLSSPSPPAPNPSQHQSLF